MNWHTKGGATVAPEVASQAWTDLCGRSHAANETDDGLTFESVYQRHFEFTWRSLRALGVDRDSLDDAAQDVFGVIARQLDGFEARSSVRTWIFGIVQNVASNHRRRRSRKSDRLEPLHDALPSGDPTPHAVAEGRELAAVVLRFCAELDEARRAAFVLGVLERVPAAEIAESLGIPLNTVYSRVHTLRKELEARIAQREVEP